MGATTSHSVSPDDDECEKVCAERRYAERFHFRETKSLQVPIMPPARDFSDFSFLSMVGDGTFASVFKVLDHQTGELYAMKLAKKNAVEGCEDALERGRFVHCYCKNEFILRVMYLTGNDLYRAVFLEFAPCGDLYDLVEDAGEEFSEDHAFFFAAQIFYAIEYLHKNHIAHRDIKPENVLLGVNGFVKLGDFNFAIYLKELPYKRAMTLCGTPGFMAPEVLEPSIGYGLSCDWYSYGVLCYRLIMGYYPFDTQFGKCSGIPLVRPPWEQICDTLEECLGHSDEEIGFIKKDPDFYEAEAEAVLFEPDDPLPKTTRNLLRGLLATNPWERLGCGKLGADEVRHHDWFKDDILCMISARRPMCPFETRTRNYPMLHSLDEFVDF